MSTLVHILLAVGGLAAAAAVALMCVVCLFVWLGGVAQKDSGEAWRHADK